jgi:hypothetical protein
MYYLMPKDEKKEIDAIVWRARLDPRRTIEPTHLDQFLVAPVHEDVVTK